MKSFLKFLVPLLLAFVSFQCTENEVPQEYTVQFNVNLPSEHTDGGRTQSPNLPEGSFIIISIEKYEGGPVLSRHKMDLYKIGNAYASAPLALPIGEYVITEFLIVREDHIAIFAAPQEGSPLAELVEVPLPIIFFVGRNEVSNPLVEVLPTEHYTPEAFGYASLTILFPENPDFSLSVFIGNEDQGYFELTTAEAFIIHGADTITNVQLEPSINRIDFDGNPYLTYTLVILKDGYAKYSREFVLRDLQGELDSTPLVILLEPAFTLRLQFPPNFTGEFGFTVTDYIGTELSADTDLRIDWGDGHLSAPDETFHQYEGAGPYFISITGDLHSIKRLNISYFEEYIKEISLNHLTSLSYLSYTAGNGPPILDLRNNKELKYLNLVLNEIKELRLPEKVKIDYAFLLGNGTLSAISVNELIDKMYAYAVSTNKHRGSIDLRSDYGELIGPPSEERIEKLKILAREYQWEVYPVCNGLFDCP